MNRAIISFLLSRTFFYIFPVLSRCFKTHYFFFPHYPYRLLLPPVRHVTLYTAFFSSISFISLVLNNISKAFPPFLSSSGAVLATA